MTRTPGGRRRARRIVIALSVAAIAMLASVGIAGAHEHREVGDGAYEMGVGFINEPAIQGQPNGLTLEVTRVPAEGEAAATATPGAGAGEEDEGEGVEGLEDTLRAEVKFGSQTMELTLEPAFGSPGTYEATFIPSASGAYTFHIFGTIEDVSIDESFTSGPETFSEVEPVASFLFPSDGTSAEDANKAAQDAKDDASSARNIGLAGLIFGGLGLIAGVAGVVMAMGARRAAGGTSPVED